MKNAKECVVCKKRAKKDLNGESLCMKHYDMKSGPKGITMKSKSEKMKEKMEKQKAKEKLKELKK